MSWILIPLHYLYIIWRAEKALELATQSGSDPVLHQKYLSKAVKYISEAERLQCRFPGVTYDIDVRYRTYQERKRASL